MTNKKLLKLVKSANEKLKDNPFDDRPPEPWTLKDITDQRDLNRANDWRLATRWPWVDAVAWVAVSDPEIWTVLENGSGSGRERVVKSVLVSVVAVSLKK